MVCKWTGLWSSKAEVMVNHMDNRQYLLCDMIFASRQRLHNTITVKRLDTAKDTSLVWLPVKHSDILQNLLHSSGTL